nr:LOW QUALITY PROTEIN: integrin alpha-E [Aotus nancymaae]
MGFYRSPVLAGRLAGELDGHQPHVDEKFLVAEFSPEDGLGPCCPTPNRDMLGPGGAGRVARCAAEGRGEAAVAGRMEEDLSGTQQPYVAGAAWRGGPVGSASWLVNVYLVCQPRGQQTCRLLAVRDKRCGEQRQLRRPQARLLVTSPRTKRTPEPLHRCVLAQDKILCHPVEHVPIPKGKHRGVTVARSHHGVLICIQVLARQPHSLSSELTGTCSLLAPDLRPQAQANFFNLENLLDPDVHVDTGDCYRNKDGSRGEDADAARRRRALERAEEQDEDEEEEEEEAGTEIAIILDGSGSIDPPDFQRAKDFIYNMMRNFYEKCFECNFALVQYGTVIQTEFDLRDSQDVMASLSRVQNITQVGNVTKTASAMQHVLDVALPRDKLEGVDFLLLPGGAISGAGLATLPTSCPPPHPLQCNFALVQYGTVIQTEFDLRDSQDVMASLSRVQNITQVGNVTKTASAMQHVLDSIFTASRGSRRKASKVMVVLTDGGIFEDPLDLETVISSPKMQGVERFAIGAPLETPFTTSWHRLASVPRSWMRGRWRSAAGRAFDWSGGALLYNTRSRRGRFLNQTAAAAAHAEGVRQYSLPWVDGRGWCYWAKRAGPGRAIGRGVRAGELPGPEGGALGGYEWTRARWHWVLPGGGGALGLFEGLTEKVQFEPGWEHLSTAGAPINSCTTLAAGYSVAVLHKACSLSYISGAPRYKHRGAVFELQEGREASFLPVLEGEQMGSYFGSELCPVDINMDGTTDLLLVAAPFYHVRGEEGRVYVYRLNEQDSSFFLSHMLSGHPGFPSARFGFAMAAVGDISQDKLTDVAIGAPLEGFAADDGAGFGSVYIYNGHRDGLSASPSQRIRASAVAPGLQYFGMSVAGGFDISGDGLADITVGTLGRAVVFRSRPVVRLNVSMAFTPSALPVGFKSDVNVSLCFAISSESGLRGASLNFTLDVDVGKQRKRLQCSDESACRGRLREWSSGSQLCELLQLNRTEGELHEEDSFSNASIKVSYQLETPEGQKDCPQPVLDLYAEAFAIFQLPYEKDCKDKLFCIAELQLATTVSQQKLVVGLTKELTLNITLTNSGEDSYMTSMALNYPRNLQFKRMQKPPSPNIQCDDPQPVASVLVMSCKIGHPVLKRSSAHVSVVWQLEENAFPNRTADITVTVTNSNERRSLARQTHTLQFRHSFVAALSKPSVMYVNPGPGLSDHKEFLFHIHGENLFGAEYQLQICVPTKFRGLQIVTVKNLTKTQASTVCTPSQERACGYSPVQHVEEWQSVSCAIASDKENVTVAAEISLDHSKELLKDVTELEILGEIYFNSSLYEGLNAENHRTKNEGIPDGACSEDSDCHPGEAVTAGNGVKTGRCLWRENSTRGTCEIFAWCPLETRSRPAEPFLKEAEDFTIFIKNYIRFPKFNFSKSNVMDAKDTAFLKSCRFGPKNHYCPIFRLGSVIRWAGSDFQDIALEGGVIGINIEWNCDLDKAASECHPHYSFSRLDNKLSKSVSSGYNFRFAKYYRDAAGVEFRTLIKAYGIRFDVMVNGKAGKFSIIPTVINLGSGVALMGAVSTSPPSPLPTLCPGGSMAGRGRRSSGEMCPSAPRKNQSWQEQSGCGKEGFLGVHALPVVPR